MTHEERDGRIRLNKLLAQRGIASRRKAEALIFEGLVTVDGTVVEHPSELIDPSVQEVRVEGRGLPAEPNPVYILLYKPRGYITGRNDPRGRKSVLDLVERIGTRVEPVGRLDFDTEGALLLTNDGELANRLTHPSRGVPKRYRAKVYRTPDARDFAAIRTGVFLPEDGRRTLPARARILEQTGRENCWIEVTVTEGRNRLIRRMFAQLGHPVSKLRRESFATLSIRGMERGQYRFLTNEEVRRIRDISNGVDAKKAGRTKRKAGHARPRSQRAG